MNENNTYAGDFGDKHLPDSMRENPFVVPLNFFENQKQQIINVIALNQLSIENSEPQFSVPTDYFQSLENNILSKIAAIKLQNKVDEDGFGLPDNYFNELEDSIKVRVSESNLKSTIKESGFEVPSDYFASLEDSITVRRIEEQLSTQIKSDGFAVPSNYFDNLEESISQTIYLEKVASLDKENEFKIPNQYFETLENRILEKVTTISKGESPKRFILPKRTINYWTAVSSAAVALMIGIGTYLSINKNTDAQPTETILANAELNLHNISDDELVKYLAQESEGDDLLQLTQIVQDDSEESLNLKKDLNDEDIEEYLNYML